MLIYKLKELILQKYGEESFSTGCELVAQWLRNAGENFWIAEDVKEMCELTKPIMKLTFSEGMLLMQLFSLKEPEDIFNYPEHIKFSSGFEPRCGYVNAEIYNQQEVEDGP